MSAAIRHPFASPHPVRLPAMSLFALLVRRGARPPVPREAGTPAPAVPGDEPADSASGDDGQGAEDPTERRA